MDNFIAIVVILIIVGLAAGYVIKAKKNGAKCIGCPSGCSCSDKNKKKEDSACACGCNGTKVE